MPKCISVSKKFNFCRCKKISIITYIYIGIRTYIYIKISSCIHIFTKHNVVIKSTNYNFSNY